MLVAVTIADILKHRTKLSRTLINLIPKKHKTLRLPLSVREWV